MRDKAYQRFSHQWFLFKLLISNLMIPMSFWWNYCYYKECMSLLHVSLIHSFFFHHCRDRRWWWFITFFMINYRFPLFRLITTWKSKLCLCCILQSCGDPKPPLNHYIRSNLTGTCSLLYPIRFLINKLYNGLNYVCRQDCLWKWYFTHWPSKAEKKNFSGHIYFQKVSANLLKSLLNLSVKP